MVSLVSSQFPFRRVVRKRLSNVNTIKAYGDAPLWWCSLTVMLPAYCKNIGYQAYRLMFVLLVTRLTVFVRVFWNVGLYESRGLVLSFVCAGWRLGWGLCGWGLWCSLLMGALCTDWMYWYVLICIDCVGIGCCSWLFVRYLWDTFIWKVDQIQVGPDFDFATVKTTCQTDNKNDCQTKL